MQILATPPLRSAALLWQPRPGSFALTVACKLTFALAPLASGLALHDDDPRALLAPTDVVPFKRRADVILVGHAYAPGGQPVTSLTARLVVGALDKSIQVTGDRSFDPSGRLPAPLPFVRMPLVWERAAGGPGTPNPAGIRANDPRVPNLLPVGVDPVRGATLLPAGFGPIAPSWPGRAAHLRHHAAGWDHDALHARPLPIDIDAAYFNAAPPDQQLDALGGDERIVLEGLHPTIRELVTHLEPIAVEATVERAQGPAEPLPLRCDTLLIDTDRAAASLVWRGVVLLRRPDEAGRIALRAVAASAREAPDDATIGIGDLLPAPALPFREGASVSSFAHPAEAPDDATIGIGDLLPAPALPFREGAGVSSFAQAPSPPPAQAALLHPSEAPDDATIGIGDLSPAPALPFREGAALRSFAQAPSPPPARAFFVEPPPLLSAPAEPAEPETVRPPRPEPAPPPPPKDEDYTIERCAKIDAALAMARRSQKEILDEQALDLARWRRISRRRLDEIQADCERGKTESLAAYDGAYVAEIEAERGPIGVEEYARLAVAQERRCAPRVLSELSLPAGAGMRVERAWMRRMTVDTVLRRQVREAMRAARVG